MIMISIKHLDFSRHAGQSSQKDMESQHSITIHWWVRGGVSEGGKVTDWFSLKRASQARSLPFLQKTTSVIFAIFFLHIFHRNCTIELSVNSSQTTLFSTG